MSSAERLRPEGRRIEGQPVDLKASYSNQGVDVQAYLRASLSEAQVDLACHYRILSASKTGKSGQPAFSDDCWPSRTRADTGPSAVILSSRRLKLERNFLSFFYAVRSYGWRNQFPKSSRSKRELLEGVVKAYGHILPFPS